MDSLSITQFKEVPLLKQSIELKRKTIDVTCGGYPTLLIDSKTSEHSGGFILQGSNVERQHGARFIYWRTLRETIYLSETCLHRNDLWHEVKIIFKGSPILSVDIDKDVNLFMLIVTTTTFHRIPIKRPSSNDSILLTEQDSVLFTLNEHVITDPMNCYNFINNIGQSVPTMATAVHCAGKNSSSFAIATANSLHLGTMSSGGDKPEVKFVKLECQTPSVANFIEQIGSVWSTNRTNQSQVVTMCCITAPNREDQPLLFTVHRDGALRVWLHSGQLLTTEYLSKYTSGSRKDFHSCVSRGSNALVGLYVSFKTFSEFVILRPTVTSGTESLTLQNVYTVLAPTFDLIDFQLCEYNLWTLWCNAKNEMQTLVCELPVQGKMGKMNWQPVATASAVDDDLLEQADGIDLSEFYCKRIFNSGLFPPVAIKKTLMMLKQDISGREGSPVIGSMLRLKRDVIACIKRQLRKEQVAMERNGPCDEEKLLETSNQLWEKFYRYCVQYSEESSRPIGLFLCEEMGGEATSFAVGLVRKHVVSFIRSCDHLEAAFYSTEPQAVAETYDGTNLLISSLKTLEQTLSQDEKLELGNFLQQQQLLAAVPKLQDDLDADMQSQEMMSQSEPEPDAEADDEDNVQTDDLSQLGAAQHHFIAFDTIRKFGAKKLDLLEAIYSLLDLLTPTSKPNSELLKQAWEENYAGGLSIFTGPHLYSELALETTKQTIELRYTMLRNLFVLQHLIRTMQCDYRNEMVNVMLARLEPRIQTLLRSYQAMSWIANTRLELDWSRGRNEIVSTYPPSQRNTPLTLLQAYARCRLYYKQSREPWHPGSTLDEPLDEIPNCSMLSLTQKANVIITHLSPMHDDFRFGEWLSESALTIHIDNYVELVGDWCPTNRFSRSFIQAKAFLLDGDTFKALDLFLKSHEGVHKERFLLKFICHYANGEKRMVSPYEIASTYFLQVIRLFELYGAHDVVPVLVKIALKHTLQPERQAMLQNIEFCSYMTLGRYKEAYKSLWENVDPARRKDCLRQLINLLLSNGDLGRLMMLPSRGHLKDFTDIIAMNARTSDMEDGLRYDFLYAFFVGKHFMRDAADIAFEGAMRYISENTSREHLQLHFRMLLKCISCLATLPTWRAWVARPMNDNSNNDAQQSLSAEPAVLNVEKLQERLTIVQAILCLAKNADDSKLLASMKPKELVTLLLHRKKYNQALQLAHSSVPAMVATVYGHLAKACVSASSTSADNTDNSWLHENCLADIPVGKDGASTAWNYLQHIIGNEPEDLAVDAHLAVLNNVVSSGASVPLWLRTWCFEHSPVQLVRTYWSHGFLEDACDCMEELFKKRYFTPGHCHHVAFPLTLYERLYYDLENSPNRSQATVDKYLRLVKDYM
ncbi:nuclear pore complex protein Nup160 homolog [Anopheles ziemanni]|uniref:nuclear pore complex protein Nup160 homolog n=1 Tax=Anopheles ziemanni TaxID=345580 RepID=UPI00265AD2C4|nr:nuclear pore complex protein Nup160 homolog isoform X1 [Anopheles coustani]XP_058178623.1 nuclear pore complex protein Nup160 homolog [Anopheles ziemanni]